MLMPTALTMTAASRVPVYLDTPETDSPVQVSHLIFTFTQVNYNVFVTLADAICINFGYIHAGHIDVARIFAGGCTLLFAQMVMTFLVIVFLFNMLP